MGKASDLSDFDRGQIVGTRRGGMSISETAESLGFSRTTVSRVFKEWRSKQKTSSERHSCGRKRLVNESGQRRLDSLIQKNKTATNSQITVLYNSVAQKGISERTARRTLKRMGYSKRTPCNGTAPSGKKRNKEAPARKLPTETQGGSESFGKS